MDKYAKWFWIILGVIFIGALEDIFLGDDIWW
jgi:carbon starvation protein CstA